MLTDPAKNGRGADKTPVSDIIKIAILAVGGQGGGVLSNWIIELAEANGYRAQLTSVPGVAQRTGATIYYCEMLPDNGREPVFALMPSAGDVDILIAAEIMEAGRAITRGLVREGHTIMIASGHRVLSVSEKIVPGDGRGEAGPVMAAIRAAAGELICFDMEEIARANKSHISASLFGALAGSGALPFTRKQYEKTIRNSGRNVEASLSAFGAAYERSTKGVEPCAPAAQRQEVQETMCRTPTGPRRAVAKWLKLVERLEALPTEVQAFARPGLEKVVDYQDVAYGSEYLKELERSLSLDETNGGKKRNFAFTHELAKYVANAMCYDDVIRVADLKTRATRSERIRDEVGDGPDAVISITEYFHPRAEEVCATLPRGLGAYIESSPRLYGAMERLFNRGRRIRTDRTSGFTVLYALGGLRRWRRKSLRHSRENEHRQRWLDAAYTQLGDDYDLAVEIIRCRRLIKGYSDTFARGMTKFGRVLGAVDLLKGRKDAAEWLRRLRDVALKDEKGEELDGAIATIESFARA